MRGNKGRKKWLDKMAVDFIVILIGLIFAIISTGLLSDMIPRASDFLLALGTALLTAGAASLLYRVLYLRTQARESIKLWCEHRRSNYGEDAYRTEKAQQIDVLGVACRHFLEILAAPNSRLRERILHHGVQVRVLFVRPGSSYAVQRALEDGKQDIGEMERHLRHSLSLAKEIYSCLETEMKHGIARATCGTFEARVTDHCIYHALTRLDNVIYWGLYTAHKPGSESPSLMIPSTVASVFKDLSEHFTRLWTREEENCWVVKFTEGDLPRFNAQMDRHVNTPVSSETV